jgi:hypothetical protein
MLEIAHPITGKPTGERLQVHGNNFENKMDWYSAKKMCEELGNGWRLPTKSELELIYTDFLLKGNVNFKKDYYWSYTETSSLRVWTLHFGEGSLNHGFFKSDIAYVCAVRTI